MLAALLASAWKPALRCCCARSPRPAATRLREAEAIAAEATSTEKKATADRRRLEREATADKQAAQRRAQTNH